jgi:hypothetical protein
MRTDIVFGVATSEALTSNLKRKPPPDVAEPACAGKSELLRAKMLLFVASELETVSELYRRNCPAVGGAEVAIWWSLRVAANRKPLQRAG